MVHQVGRITNSRFVVRDNSPEKKSKGFTHGFVVTFRNEKGRDAYLPHPAHKAFVKIAGPVIDDVLVFDYWATK